MKIDHIVPVLMASSLLAACGGGGSSSSSTTTGSTSNNTNTAVTLADASSVYTGNRNLALLTTTNSLEFVNLVFGTENINNNITPPSARPATADAAISVANAGNLLASQQVISALAASQIASQRYQAKAIDLRDDCPAGGSASAVGDLDNTTLTGTLQVTYSQCKSENVTTNGTALVVVHGFNLAALQPTAYTVSMKGLGIQVGNVSYTATGTLRTDTNATTGQETLTVNQYQRNLSTGKQQLAENVKMLVETSGSTTITGQFCEGTHGCVTATTISPFRFDADGIPLEGEMILTGAANSKLQVIAQGYDTSVTPAVRKMRVNVDANGDGVYEAQSSRNESILKNYSPSSNTAPKAVISSHAAITLGATLQLDGSKTTDAEGDFLSYQWTLESAPAGNTAVILNPNGLSASFTPDKQGSYTLSLKVTDALGSSHLATTSVNVLGAVRPLASHVVDAEYSNLLDKLVTVSSQPHTLTILNPASGSQQSVALDLPPTSLTLSPDGKTALVGHGGAVSRINLVTATTAQVYSNLGIQVFDIAMNDNDMAYLTPPASMNLNYLYALNLADGVLREDAGSTRLYGGAHLQAIPGLKAVYALDTAAATADLSRYDTSANPPVRAYDSPYQGQHDLGGSHANLWASEDGMYLLTAGGTLFQTANQQAEDLLYLRTLGDDAGRTGNYLVHADHSQTAAKFVAIEAEGSAYSLKTYTSPLLNRETSLSLAGLSVDGSSSAVTPTFAFFNAAGTERYALLSQAGKAYLLPF